MQEGPNWESNIIKPSFSSAAIMKVLSETAPTSCFIGTNVILVFFTPNKVATRVLQLQQNWWDNFTSFDTSST